MMTYTISRTYYMYLLVGTKGIKGLGTHENVLAYLNSTAGIRGRIEQIRITDN
mgnify:CR=1 FL=1